MSLGVPITLFLLSLGLSIIASLVLARELDKLGARLHLSEGMLGLITALGADAPEISSAMTALISGNHDLGLGVILGSNLFNLAALLGLSAIIAGEIRIKRQGLLWNGSIAFLITVIISALIFGWLPLIVCSFLLVIIFLPYVVLSALHPTQVKQIPLPQSVERFLSTLLSRASKDARKDQQAPESHGSDMLAIIPALVSIVLASVGMVTTATSLGAAWHIPHTIIGTFVLATLTGIPNMLAAIHLALRQRGSAVVSEALNSNTLNLLSGAFLPTLLLGIGAIAALTRFELWWLVGLTFCTIALAAFRGRLSRWNGAVIIGLYLLFAAFQLIFVAS